MKSQELLGYLLREARELVNRSPEQAGEAAGVSGRTIRRLEEPGPDTTRPRQVTLDALANFYGLRPRFVRRLATWDLAGEELAVEVRGLAAETLGAETLAELAEEEDELKLLAMRLARGPATSSFGSAAQVQQKLLLSFPLYGSGARGADAEVFGELLLDYCALDRRRQRMLRELARDLRAAAERERAERRES